MCVEIDLILERDVNRRVWVRGIRLIRLGEGISLPLSLPACLPDRRPLRDKEPFLWTKDHLLIAIN